MVHCGALIYTITLAPEIPTPHLQLIVAHDCVAQSKGRAQTPCNLSRITTSK